jgi:hypothetical protein
MLFCPERRNGIAAKTDGFLVFSGRFYRLFLLHNLMLGVSESWHALGFKDGVVGLNHAAA